MIRVRQGWRAAIGGLVVGLALVGALPAGAITAEEKAKLDKGAQETIDELNRLLDEDISSKRTSCAMGRAPEGIAAKRAKFTAEKFPDASRMCVSILGTKGGKGQLGELYRDLLGRLGGDVAGAARWPDAIGGAVLADKSTVAIGNDKAITVQPALAFDAGFTVAYQEGSASQMQDADAGQLQALAESCLAQHQEAGACFSAGYLFGAAAVRGKWLLAP